MMLLQRAALLSALIVLALTAAIASPARGINRRKRDTSDNDDGFYHSSSSSFSSNFNGDGFLTSDSYPGFGFYSRSAFPLFFPWFSFPSIVPWYKGPNVCKDTRYADEPEAFKDMTKGSRSGSTSGRSREESCKGNNDEYTCRGSEMIDGKMKMYMTVYACCHGFVRNPKAPGCMEGSTENEPSAEDGLANNYPNDGLESY